MTTLSTFVELPTSVQNLYVDELLMEPIRRDDSAFEHSIGESSSLKVVFIPEGVTPLDAFPSELAEAGYGDDFIKDVMDGLKDSPLYEDTGA